MNHTILDFRSDTVTQPAAAMRQAMADAPVGDDVLGEDPTINRLEARVAELFGREAALFVPSGTMGNLIGIALHCGRGDEVIVERRTHSFAHEVGGASALLGVVFNTLDTPQGVLTAAEVEAAIRPLDVHEPLTKLAIVENTANLSGGRIVALDRLDELRAMTRRRRLALHMDGARVWNASVASGVPLSEYGRRVDTLSCCLSKGLGCPVGSLVVGDKSHIAKGRWYRKMFGGGLRQAGILAAAGLYALDHHIARLAGDHAVAAELARGLGTALDKRFRVQTPETNILLVHTDGQATTAAAEKAWNAAGVLCFALSPTTIRFVAHLDLPAGAAAEAVRRIAAVTPAN